MKHLRYRLEALILHLIVLIFKTLPPVTASALGGFLGRSIGSKLPASRKAMANLDLIFPNKLISEKDKIVMEMWDNLGRIIAEYPHLEILSKTRTDIVNPDIIKNIIEQAGGAVFIGGHTGNWEINGAALYTQFGQTIDLTYRPPNNPYAAGLLNKSRTLNGKLGAFPKARETARKLVKSLQDGRYLGVMIDQKFNEGIASLFLGHPAMTNPAPFQLSQKFGVPLVFVLSERLPGCRFKMHVLEPLDTHKPLDDVMAEANSILSDWIIKHPGQWLWLHSRWNARAIKEWNERT